METFPAQALMGSPPNANATHRQDGKSLEATLNLAITLMSSVCLAVLVYTVLKIFFIHTPPVVHMASQGSIPASVESVLTPAKPFSDTFMDSRNIFGDDLSAPASPTPEEVKSPPVNIANYKVLAIFLDNDPRAVIEDTQAKDVLTLGRGASLGPMVIDDIQSGKVTVLYQGQKIELTP